MANTAAHIITATSVTLLLAGQLAVLLFLGKWAIAGLLGLPYVALIVLLAISGVASAAIAVIIFVRVLRVEARLAQNKSADDIGWSLFMNRQTADTPPAGLAHSEREAPDHFKRPERYRDRNHVFPIA